MSAEYILATGNESVVLCERGIRTFETSTRNTLDIAAVPVLRRHPPADPRRPQPRGRTSRSGCTACSCRRCRRRGRTDHRSASRSGSCRNRRGANNSNQQVRGNLAKNSFGSSIRSVL